MLENLKIKISRKLTNVEIKNCDSLMTKKKDDFQLNNSEKNEDIIHILEENRQHVEINLESDIVLNTKTNNLDNQISNDENTMHKKEPSQNSKQEKNEKNFLIQKELSIFLYIQ